MTTARDPRDLQRALVQALRNARTAPTRTARQAHTRKAAELSVDLRAACTDADGHPDWAGRSAEYRDALRTAYTLAGWGVADGRAYQGAVRKQISSVLRERLTPDQLEALGMQPESDADGVTRRNRARAALVRAASAPATDAADPDVVRSVAGALAVLRRVPAERIAALAEHDRGLVTATLAEIERRVRELQAASNTE